MNSSSFMYKVLGLPFTGLALACSTSVVDDGETTEDEPDDTSAEVADTSEEPSFSSSPLPSSGDETLPAGDERFGCGADLITESATTVDGAIDEDTTWSGVVVIDGKVDVKGSVEFVIEAGTRIVMTSDAVLNIGALLSAVSFRAQGTEERPIVFCGEEPERGFWSGLNVGGNVLSESAMSHVYLFDGGGVDSEAALHLASAVQLENVTVSNSGTAGVSAAAFAEGSTRLSVVNSESVAILTSAAAVTHFPLGGSFDDNDAAVIKVDFTTASGDVTFHDNGVPYLQEGRLSVTEGTLKFEAGVEYRFASDAYLNVGHANADTLLDVSGTEEDPVVFRGASEEAGYWGGVTVGSKVKSNSKIVHLHLGHAGGDDRPALDVQAPITLRDVVLSDNRLGLYVGAQGLAEGSENISVQRTQSHPITVEAAAIATLPAGGHFADNEPNQVRVLEGTYYGEGSIANLGIAYNIEGTFKTKDDTNVTVEAGTHFVMSPDSEIVFGWSGSEALVQVVGTEDTPIRFTGEVEEAGSWVGISVMATVLSSSEFRHVEIAHAGSEGSAMLVYAPVTIENSSFRDYDGVGIALDSGVTLDYTLNNTFDATAVSVF